MKDESGNEKLDVAVRAVIELMLEQKRDRGIAFLDESAHQAVCAIIACLKADTQHDDSDDAAFKRGRRHLAAMKLEMARDKTNDELERSGAFEKWRKYVEEASLPTQLLDSDTVKSTTSFRLLLLAIRGRNFADFTREDLVLLQAATLELEPL